MSDRQTAATTALHRSSRPSTRRAVTRRPRGPSPVSNSQSVLCAVALCGRSPTHYTAAVSLNSVLVSRNGFCRACLINSGSSAASPGRPIFVPSFLAFLCVRFCPSPWTERGALPRLQRLRARGLCHIGAPSPRPTKDRKCRQRWPMSTVDCAHTLDNCGVRFRAPPSSSLVCRRAKVGAVAVQAARPLASG